MEYKRAYGPLAKSCLTCKRRHKKCDQRRPHCERCIKGGYECAYGPSERPGPSRSSLVEQPRSDDLRSQDEGQVAFGATASSSSQSETPSFISTPDVDLSQGIPLPESSQQRVRTNQSQNHSAAAALHALQSMRIFNTRIPQSITIPSETLHLINQVMSSFDQIASLTLFRPMRHHLIEHRDLLLFRLQSSTIARRIKFVSFKIYEAIHRGDDWRYHNVFNRWLGRLEQELCSEHGQDQYLPGSSQIVQVPRFEALEITYLRMMLHSHQSTYPYLRYSTPAFLQTVSWDPTLWSFGQNSRRISLARIFDAPRCEFGNFVVKDTLYAMAYGLPQMVEYDTSVSSSLTSPPIYESLHGCPTDFHILLAEINACRDNSPNARDWQEIENRLVTWQVRPHSQYGEWESWIAVAWLGIQESWRHMLLAYLYMAVCGVSSDDLRVQSSVKQIFQIAKAVRKPEGRVACAQPFAQYFIAGLCAHTERHRMIARQKLVELSEYRSWQVNGTIFVPVLDHLWHGAAAGGRPIKWSDYMHSREVVLPVSV